MKKVRADVLLVEKGYFESREQAKRSIMAGLVYADDEPVDKPGAKIDSTALIRVKGETHPYVSRGGLKLEKAIASFGLSFQNKIVLDIGASTGGFTDCALQHGAKLVYAVDVGYNQLAWKLRNHKQVEVMERYNFRYASKEDFTKGKVEIAVADVSFISLKLLLPPLCELLTNDADVCLLIKPQFEAGKEKVGKKGIVRNADVHVEVISDIVTFSSQLQFVPWGLDYSPITGGDGNIEYLFHAKWLPKNTVTSAFSITNIPEIVRAAHRHHYHERG
ncbi:TlyA family RNA methyltransferase [Aliibacillus thermotolerans]|uniref:TlyA family RNA methyltransferase n=1 Tax=Aliibacillus thermotolerans TaxID=1834418 RepID=A0ABW0U6V8_9BACI|nr:TlyA family RNA methyltransferase [Aliibacillus thermotolerans]MDA3131144.1 TlyA family rRNA (cytidine-2'-O)-methyltransferase [Aliibacillus thermotolerans]